MSSIVSDRIQSARTSNHEEPTGANRVSATFLAPILQIRAIGPDPRRNVGNPIDADTPTIPAD